jgi:hypothetical protein
MALPGNVLTISPEGVTDALAANTAPPGSMASLVNLIPDPSTRNLWQCRPAAITLINLATALPAGSVISGMIAIGTRLYGMVSSTTFPGKDQPFCYDVQTNSIVPITGLYVGGVAQAVTAASLPTTPPAAGPWTPPSFALCGSNLIIAHPGYTTASGVFFGVISTLNPFKLTYQGTNTLANALIFPPSWVQTFNGRVFFLVNPPGQQPAAYMSDSLNALQITNANQILTFGDNIPLTVAAGLGLSNQLLGGVVQALIIFKGVSALYQVTGDYALGNLEVNTLNAATGTLAPNTVNSTEKGVMFMAPDGVRLIDLGARVSDPIGKDGQGVTLPFYNALVPSRANAAYNSGLYRVQMQNGLVAANPQQEWWYDVVRDKWSGPHTTAIYMVVPYANTFLVALQAGGSKIFQSDVVQSPNSTFVENGTQLTWIYQPTYFPDQDKMCEFCTIETTLTLQLGPNNSLPSAWSSGWSSGWGSTPNTNAVAVSFIDQNSNVVDTANPGSAVSGSLWGNFLWGVGKWGGAADNLYPRQLNWHLPVVFRRGTIQATGASSSYLKIGDLRVRMQELGYLQLDPVA